MLELALSVRDKRVIENSLTELEIDEAALLLNKLTARLAKKPNRAVQLVVWVQFLLQSGKIRSSKPLIPLKNLLQERVDSFPQMLQLEGRLSMLAQM